MGYFDEAKKIYVNWDGAHDNVNYTCVYTLIHFLVCAESAGWPLREFVILRLPVGHTHVLLDAAWGILSLFIYGRHSRGDARRDVLDWQQLYNACDTAFGPRLEIFEHLQGCFDFDTFVRSYRPPAADAGLSKHYAVHLRVEDGVVYARSRPDIDPVTPWSQPVQLFPPKLAPRTQPHAHTVSPGAAPLQEWKLQDKVQRDLRKFYSGKMRYKTCDIPDDVKEGMCIPSACVQACAPSSPPLYLCISGMLNFLETMGEQSSVTPAWINWTRNPHRGVVSEPDTAPDDPEDADSEAEYVPIGGYKTNADGKICKCGSGTHMTVTSRMCPLNSKWADHQEDADRLQVSVVWCLVSCVLTLTPHHSCTFPDICGVGTTVMTENVANIPPRCGKWWIRNTSTSVTKTVTRM